MGLTPLINEISQRLTTAFAQLDGWFAAPAPLRAHRPADGGWTVDEVLKLFRKSKDSQKSAKFEV